MPKNIAWREAALVLRDEASSRQVATVLDKILKLKGFVDRGHNIGDLLANPDNSRSLQEAFGPDWSGGLRFAAQIALNDYACESLGLVPRAIDGVRVAKDLAALTSLDVALSWDDGKSFRLINPRIGAQWKDWPAAGPEICVGLFVKCRSPLAKDEARRKQAEGLALMRSSLLQSLGAGGPGAGAAAPFEYRVIVDKLDGLVHAGNANLVIEHLKTYAGRVRMFVQRDKREEMILQYDSIWSANIRNGEPVLFVFFDGKPEPGYLTELARHLNKPLMEY